MKRFLYVFLALFLLSCGSNGGGVSPSRTGMGSSATARAKLVQQAIENGRYRDGEILVRFKPGVSARSRAQEAAGGKPIPLINARLVSLPPGTSVKQAVQEYMNDPNVEFAEPNYIRRADSKVPNDTYFAPQQWALSNTGVFAGGTPGADIKAPGAWDITTGSSSVVIAVLDSGIDYSHPDLVNNVWTNTAENCNNGLDDDGNGYVDDCVGWNFVNKTNNPVDDNGHGTHVSGIAGAAGNNGFGIAGVMWRVRLMPLKVLNENGEGTISDEIDAIQYAIDNGARVINASFGGTEYSQSEADAIQAAGDHGIIFVTSAGNGGDDGTGDNIDLAPDYPGSYRLPNIITVAATDQNDRLASFSNFGPATVHVAAPGVYILSTIPPGLSTTFLSLCTRSAFAEYDFCQGTSMAAPHVSGLAGLLYSFYPSFSYSQVRGMILKYVDTFRESPNLQSLDGWVYTSGRINAEKALKSLLAPSDLSAAATSAHDISLSWTDNATGEDSYVIERKQSGSDFEKIAEAGPGSTTFTDSSLYPGVEYTYRVKAFSSLPNPPTNGSLSADSAYSGEAAATTPAEEQARSDDGGGGCSVAGRRDSSTAMGDALLFALPFAVFATLSYRRRKK